MAATAKDVNGLLIEYCTAILNGTVSLGGGAVGAGTAATATRVTYASDGATIPVKGGQAAGVTAVDAPVSIGGMVTTSNTAWSAGQRGELQFTTTGSAIVAIGSGSATATVGGLSDAQAAVNGVNVNARTQSYNGATYDINRNIVGLATSGIGVQAAGLVGQSLTTFPTLANGDYGRVQLSTRGSLRTLGTVLNIVAADGITNSSFGTLQDDGTNNNATRPTLVGPIVYDSVAGTWQRQRGDAANGIVVQASTQEYETVAASQTAQILGATGAVGDLIDSILIVPATTSPGAVTITDGNGSAITVFTGGASSVSNLVPFSVPLGLKCVNATTPGWKVTTGTNVSVIGIGNFT